jgi:hypothetical protein
VIIPGVSRSEQRMRRSARRIANLDDMNVLINLRSGARLAAVCCSLVVALAPITVVASMASTVVPSAGGVPGRHAPAYDLCDGHKWSLFGCRPDHRVAVGRLA